MRGSTEPREARARRLQGAGRAAHAAAARRVALSTLCCAALLAAGAVAASQQDGRATAEGVEPGPRVARRDLAALVERLDARLAPQLVAGALKGDALRAVNERFDALSLRFFALRFGDVYAELDAWLAELEGARRSDAPFELATALARNRAAEQPWRPLGGARARIEALLGGPEAAAIDESTLRVLRARLALLVDEPSVDRSCEFLLATPALAAAVEDEAQRALAGARPYADTRGDLWRTVAHRRRDLALRLYVPPELSAPFPLVIAFHGAGGDENFLFELAGDGYLKRLAEVHGFAVACPRTADFAYSPSAFEALLEGLAADLPIDRTRVFLFGHSLGAGAVASLCALRPESIRKAVCVAGFGTVGSDAPDLLVIGGTLDPLARAEGLERAVLRSRERGARVEFLALPDQGHTLILPEAMRRAVAFWFGL